MTYHGQQHLLYDVRPTAVMYSMTRARMAYEDARDEWHEEPTESNKVAMQEALTWLNECHRYERYGNEETT